MPIVILWALSTCSLSCTDDGQSAARLTCETTVDCPDGYFCSDLVCERPPDDFDSNPDGGSPGMPDGGLDAGDLDGGGVAPDGSDDAGPEAGSDAEVSDSGPGEPCGDGVQVTPEQCDDGNRLSGDGCSGDCQLEASQSFESPARFAPPPGGPLAHCLQYRQMGATLTGVYIIDPDGEGPRSPFDAYCDMETDGGGFTVITWNQNGDAEPTDCVPVIASTDALACGDGIEAATDFSVPSYGIPFTELVWLVFDDGLSAAAQSRVAFDASQSIPNAELFSLVADTWGALVPTIAAPELRCSGVDPSVKMVANVHPQAFNIFDPLKVVTVFAQQLPPAGPHNLGLTDAFSGANGSVEGVDDFQDGTGCNDDWEPKTVRGFGSWVMIR